MNRARLTALLAGALVTSSCAGAASRPFAGASALGDQTRSEAPAELPAARPTVAPGEAGAATAGAPVAVQLGARRAQAAAIYLEMLRRIAVHDATGAAALFDGTVIDLPRNEARGREAVSSWFERLMVQADVSLLATALPALRVTTLTPAEGRRRHTDVNAAGIRDGWVVESPPRSWGPANGIQSLMPLLVVVRFDEGDARIVATRFWVPPR